MFGIINRKTFKEIKAAFTSNPKYIYFPQEELEFRMDPFTESM